MIAMGMYAGSFDPVTIGHEWIIKHAPGSLIVVVATNPEKKYRFTSEERFRLIHRSIDGLGPRVAGKIEVDILDEKTYLVDYAMSRGVRYLIRGARSTKDFEFEQAYADVNRTINSGLCHLIMMPPPDLRSISSSVVRTLVGPAGWEKVVAKYVSPHVVEALRGTQAII
jgi:pantetheine-phosphate adenylyltransferase